MPLSALQTRLLRLLASHRNPESYVAGAIALNRDGPRYSSDIDIFHDGDERLVAQAEADAKAIIEDGLTLTWATARGTGKRSAIVSGNDDATQLEWVADSDFRFFPCVPDELFGYMLHPADLATNKAVAAADRRVPRDIVDLVTIDEMILPLGAVVWAAVGRFPGPTPEEMLAEITRHSRFSAEEFRALAMIEPVDPADINRRIRRMLDAASVFIGRMPSDLAGVLFLDGDKVVQPDPDHLERYLRHAGQRRGHWPSSPEIARAMLERFVGSGKS